MKQVIVITGASAGVGRATVRAFARRGADIALIARGLDGLEGARRDVEFEGGRAYDSQQTEQPADPDRPCNLWTPLAGDHGAMVGLARAAPSPAHRPG